MFIMALQKFSYLHSNSRNFSLKLQNMLRTKRERTYQIGVEGSSADAENLPANHFVELEGIDVWIWNFICFWMNNKIFTVFPLPFPQILHGRIRNHPSRYRCKTENNYDNFGDLIGEMAYRMRADTCENAEMDGWRMCREWEVHDCEQQKPLFSAIAHYSNVLQWPIAIKWRENALKMVFF